MKRLVTFSIALLFLSGLGRAEAAFVTYTETATGTGFLGSLGAFTNALVTITGTADTNNVAGSGGIFTVLTSTTVTVAGTGSATFTDIIQAVANQGGPLAGFGDNTQNLFVLGNNNAAFASYNLKSSIGPLSGDVVFNSGSSFGTTVGSFFLNTVSNASFAAVVGTATVPEPSSLAMMGLGLALVATWRRTKARRSIASQA